MAREVEVGDLSVTVGDDFVAEVEIRRPPNNYFDLALIRDLANVYEELDDDSGCRSIVLCSQGKHFCAGADHGNELAQAGENATSDPATPDRHLFDEAVRLFRTALPVVAAVQGAAIGGGLGLALSADFRVGAPETRMSANFVSLGSHHGFGLTLTLPPLVGQQRALELLLRGTRLKGDEAFEMGLCDRLVESGEVRAEAHRLAAELAAGAPLAVAAIRKTMRSDLVDGMEAALQTERDRQDELVPTHDRLEGVAAVRERRPAVFTGT